MGIFTCYCGFFKLIDKQSENLRRIGSEMTLLDFKIRFFLNIDNHNQFEVKIFHLKTKPKKKAQSR